VSAQHMIASKRPESCVRSGWLEPIVGQRGRCVVFDQVEPENHPSLPRLSRQAGVLNSARLMADYGVGSPLR